MSVLSLSELDGPGDSIARRKAKLKERQTALQLMVAQGRDMRSLNGEMVSGHFVAPAATQRLAGLVNQVQVGNETRATAQEESMLADLELRQVQSALKQLGQPDPADLPRDEFVTQNPPDIDRAAIIGSLIGNSQAGNLPNALTTDLLIAGPRRKEEAATRLHEKEQSQAARAAEAELERRARTDDKEAQRAWQQVQDEKFRRSEEQRQKEFQLLLAQRGATGGGGVSGGGQAKAPSGFRWNGDNLEAIPGGPADQDRKPLPAAAATQQQSLLNLESGLNDYAKMLDGYDPQSGDAASPTKRKQIGAAFTDMQMRLKEAYNLGAITGPDMQVLSGALTDPTSARGTIEFGLTGKEPLKAQITEARKSLARQRGNFETQYGRSVGEASKGAEGSWDAPKTQTPVKVRSRADVDKLPKGTLFVTPDGRVMEK